MISTANDELSVARSVSVLIMAVTIYAANQLLQTAVEPRFHTSSDCKYAAVDSVARFLCTSPEATSTAFRCRAHRSSNHTCSHSDIATGGGAELPSQFGL